MNKEILYEALGNIDDRHVRAAHAPGTKPKPAWPQWAAAAACLALLIIGAALLLPEGPQTLPQPQGPSGTVTPPEGQGGITVEEPGSVQPPADAGIKVHLADIRLNPFSETVSAAPKWYDPKLYESFTWDRDASAAYFGKDMVPVYTPPGMKTEVGGTAVAEKDGPIVADTLWIGWSREDGGADGPKMDLTASKLGLLSDCIYLLEDDRLQTSLIGGVEVTFGHRAMPQGPYDPETKEPAGYYDLYVADLTHDGIQYRIVSRRMALEEVVKVAAAIIFGEPVELIRQ